MKLVQQARLVALHLIKAFLDKNADALGTVNQSASRLALDDVLTKVELRASDQTVAETRAARATLDKNRMRADVLTHQMLPLAAIARANLAHVPNIGKLRLPSDKVNDSTFITRGNAMAEVAAQYVDVFVGEQLPVTFVDDLRTSVEAVRKAAVERDGYLLEVTSATQALDDEMVRAQNVVKVLNSLVVRQLKGRGDLLAGWRRAKHVKAKPGVPQGTTNPAVPATPPVTTHTVVPATPPAPAPASTAPAQQAAAG